MLNNKTIIICGAAGIIGSEIVKVLSKNNRFLQNAKLWKIINTIKYYKKKYF